MNPLLGKLLKGLIMGGLREKFRKRAEAKEEQRLASAIHIAKAEIEADRKFYGTDVEPEKIRPKYVRGNEMSERELADCFAEGPGGKVFRGVAQLINDLSVEVLDEARRDDYSAEKKAELLKGYDCLLALEGLMLENFERNQAFQAAELAEAQKRAAEEARLRAAEAAEAAAAADEKTE